MGLRRERMRDVVLRFERMTRKTSVVLVVAALVLVGGTGIEPVTPAV